MNKAEATTKVTAAATTIIQEAELHGNMMTVAEAMERHDLERDWDEQQERERCGDKELVVMLLSPRESSIYRGGGLGRRRRRRRTATRRQKGGSVLDN